MEISTLTAVLYVILSALLGAALAAAIGSRTRKTRADLIKRLVEEKGADLIKRLVEETGDDIHKKCRSFLEGATARLEKLASRMGIDFKVGDWVIGSAAECSDGNRSYAQRAVFVVELTMMHVIVYDPYFAENKIECLANNAKFVRATKSMVDMAWKKAKDQVGGYRDNPVTDEEIAKYPFKADGSKEVDEYRENVEKAEDEVQPGPRMVKLKNGTEEVAGVVDTLMESIKELGMEHATSFHELFLLCRDKNYKVFGGWDGEHSKAMRGLVLVEGSLGDPPSLRVTGTVRNVILSAVTGHGLGMKIGSPFPESVQPEPIPEPHKAIEAGKRVKITKLESTVGMMINALHISVRKEGITGTLQRMVPGHGGDVWFVKHDGSDDIGAYCFTEFEVLKDQEEPESKSKDDPDAIVVGREVKITKLSMSVAKRHDFKALKIAPTLAEARHTATGGTIQGRIEGSGGDLWIVQHTGEVATMAVYSVREFELVKEKEGPSS